MIDFNSPIQHVAGLTVFADHADKRVHYVVPSTPSLVVLDQKPRLSLSMFRGEQQGALFNFETTLQPTEHQLEKLKEHFVAYEEPVFLTPDWHDGVVRVAGWYTGDETTPNSLIQVQPSLMGSPHALVSARLNKKESTIALAALSEAVLPLAIIFELETLALTGPLAVRAEADVTALHDRLTAKGALHAPMTKAEVKATWEEALHDGAIRIEVTDQSINQDEARADAMQRIGEHLILNMLTPHPPAEAPPMLDDKPIAAIELSFRLTMRRETLSTTARFDFSERSTMVLRHYAAANLIGMIDPDDVQDLIHTIDLEPSSRSIVVRIEPELRDLSISAIEVDIRLAGETDVHETVVLTDDAPEAQYETRSGWNQAFEYRVRCRYNADISDMAARTTDWTESGDGSILLSPRRLFPEQESRLLLSSSESDWLHHVKVVFDLPDGSNRSALLTSTTRLVSLRWPGVEEEALDATVHWVGEAGEPATSVQLSLPLAGSTFLESPFGESISVFAVPLPLGEVSSMFLEVQYQDAAMPQEKTAEWTGDDWQPVTLRIRRLKDSDRHYRYRTTKVLADGNLVQSDWISTQTSQLIIGTDTPAQIHRVTVVLLGGVERRGAIAAEIVLKAGDTQSRQVLERQAERAEMAIVLPLDQQHAQLHVTEFLADGSVREVQIDEPDELTVISMPLE